MKKLFYLLVLSATILSCEKDKDPTLQGKWTISSITTTEYTNGTAGTPQTHPGDGRTINFQDNGIVIGEYNGATESYPYTIHPGDKVEFDGETYDIRNLEENSVTLFLRDDWGAPTYYDEIQIFLTR